MADSSARRVEFKPNKQTKPNRRQRIVLDLMNPSIHNSTLG